METQERLRRIDPARLAAFQAEPNFAAFEKLYGIHYVIPESATFATAIGAGLCSLRQKSVK